MPYRRTTHSLVLTAVVLAFWTAAVFAAARATGATGSGDHYNLPKWIAVHLSRIWLNPIAHRLGGGYVAATDAQVLTFLEGESAVAAAERDLAYAEAAGSDPQSAVAAVHAGTAALKDLEWPVEERLSQELAATIRADGLESRLPVFDSLNFLWPRVAFGYGLPPNVLVQSPRDRIELKDSTLLRSGLSPDQVARITQTAEAGGDTALVVQIGGLAAYPSVVEEDNGYADSLELLAHEWTHQYLFFQPLGIRYFQNHSMLTINETVANMVGRELAAHLRERFPLSGSLVRVRPLAPPPDASLNFDRTLHQLRLEVDAMLADGRVDEAERRMNEVQQTLVAHGYYVGKINQAYFAFYGSYADSAASTSPLGPRLSTLRSRYRDLGAFVRAVQTIRSAEELSRLQSASAR